MAIKHAQNALEAQQLQPGWLVEYNHSDQPPIGMWGILQRRGGPEDGDLKLEFNTPLGTPQQILAGPPEFCDKYVKRILPVVHPGCGYDAWDALGVISVVERRDRRDWRYHHLGGDSHGLLQFTRNSNRDIIIHFSCNVQNSFQARVAGLLLNRFYFLEEWLKANGGRSLAKQ